MLEVKKPLPPPSINLIPGKIGRTYNNVAKTLNRAKVQSKVTVLTGGVNKINVTNDEEFRRLRNQVTEDGWEYYTFEDKNTSPHLTRVNERTSVYSQKED